MCTTYTYAHYQHVCADQPDADQDWCPLPILHHEPFNTWESWFFWNVTAHLLAAGPAFCHAPHATRTGLFEQWKTGLHEVRGAPALIQP